MTSRMSVDVTLAVADEDAEDEDDGVLAGGEAFPAAAARRCRLVISALSPNVSRSNLAAGGRSVLAATTCPRSVSTPSLPPELLLLELELLELELGLVDFQ